MSSLNVSLPPPSMSSPSPPHSPSGIPVGSALSGDSPSPSPPYGFQQSTTSPSSHFLCPDFKRRQLLFDSFSKFQHRHLGESSVSALSSSLSSPDGNSMGIGMGVALGGSSLLTTEGAKGSLLYSWGAGYHGQLGLNTARKKCRLVPTLIDFHEPVQQVACGGFHSALLTDDGRVFTWGDGRSGQLGNLVRKHNMHSTPHLVDFFVNSKVTISFIACGQSHTAVISSAGKLYTFGSGKNGQLGHGIRLDERFPRRVDTDRSLGSFVRVACGDRHTAVLSDSGRVVTFGSSQHGQLGHGDESDLLRPTEITQKELTDHRVTFIECGATTTAAITDSGKLFIWGFGESIHPKGMNNVVNTPRLVDLKDKVKQVGLGQGHVVVLNEQGDVLTFGTSSFGQLGHGATSNVRNPRLILKGKEIQQISCGRYHTMAVSSYGVIYSFGCNESGQLGHNNLDNGLMPRIVESILPNVIGQVKCGQHHTLALSSIQHDAVSPDVLTWKAVEDSEFKLKSQMVQQNPNGLKSKHIIQVEKERETIRKAIEESQRKDSEEKAKLAKEKIDLILNHSDLQSTAFRGGGIAKGSFDEKGDDDDDNGGSLYDIIQIAHHKDHSNTVVETPSAKSKTPHSHEDEDDNDNDDDDEQGNSHANDEKSAESEDSSKPQRRSNSSLPSLGPHSQLYLDAADSQWTAKKFPPQPKALSLTKQSPPKGNKKKSSESTESAAAESPKSPSAENAGDSLPPIGFGKKFNRTAPSSSTALIPSPGGNVEGLSANSTTLSASFSPLAPRISFIESQAKSLAKVKSFISSNPIQGSPEYTSLLLKMKKDYNKLKNYRVQLEEEIRTLKKHLAITKPNQEEEKETNRLMDRVKHLNMKLVTLNTRLIEAEENKKNYELTIIRMKEEDLQLSKQIDHLRHLVMEYERLLLRLQKMNERVSHQKSFVYEESSQFWNEIQEFVQFADRTVGDYQSVLNASFAQSSYQENLQLSREVKQEEKRNGVLNKLREEIDSIRRAEESISSEKSDWNGKVEFYEKKFRRIVAATGLSQIDQIIAKFFFNDEITKDLKAEIEAKKTKFTEIQKALSALQGDLQTAMAKQKIHKWKDVSQLEAKNTEEQLKLNKHREEAELQIHRKTMAIESLHALWKNVKSVLKENLSEGDASLPEEDKEAADSAKSSSLPPVLSPTIGLSPHLRVLQGAIDSVQRRLNAAQSERKKIEIRRKEIESQVNIIKQKENDAKTPMSPSSAAGGLGGTASFALSSTSGGSQRSDGAERKSERTEENNEEENDENENDDNENEEEEEEEEQQEE